MTEASEWAGPLTRRRVMMNTHWLLREMLGAGLSAGLTLAIFGLPLAMLGFNPTERVHRVLEQPSYSAAFDAQGPADRAGIWVRLPLPDGEDDAPEVDPDTPLEFEENADSPSTAEATVGAAEESQAQDVQDAAERVEVAEKQAATVAQARREAEPGVGEPVNAKDGEGAVSSGEIGGTDVEGARQLVRQRVIRTPSRRGSGKGARCSKAHPDIDKVSEGRYTVDRDLIEYYTSSFERLKSLGWSGRHAEDDVVGWRISSFGCNSPLYHAGLRRNDVIQSVNGRNTRNALQVFAAWKALRKQEAFDVVLVRRGEELRLYFEVI